MKDYVFIIFCACGDVSERIIHVISDCYSDNVCAVANAFAMICDFKGVSVRCIVWDVEEDCQVAEVHI